MADRVDTPALLRRFADNPAHTYAMFLGRRWRVARVQHWPYSYCELETPAGGRTTVPCNRLHTPADHSLTQRIAEATDA